MFKESNVTTIATKISNPFQGRVTCSACGRQVKEDAVSCSACQAVFERESIIGVTAQTFYSIKQQEINRGFFDRKDPIEGAGFHLDALSISRNYFVDPEQRAKLPTMKTDLYDETIKMINTGRIGAVNARVIDYQDIKYKPKEETRRYLIVEHETTRGTMLTTLARFYTVGDNFYVALDSYVLGPVNWFGVATQAIILLIILRLTVALWDWSEVLAVLPLIYLYWIWIDVIRALSQGSDWPAALRQRFTRPTSNSSFDFDDANIFLKSLLPLILTSVQSVFEKHGLAITGLEEDINRINQQVINYSDHSTKLMMSGGSIANSAIGGVGHRIMSGR